MKRLPGPPGCLPCSYVEMTEEGELTRFWSAYFTSVITAEACDRHIQSLQCGFLITDDREERMQNLNKPMIWFVNKKQKPFKARYHINRY